MKFQNKAAIFAALLLSVAFVAHGSPLPEAVSSGSSPAAPPASSSSASKVQSRYTDYVPNFGRPKPSSAPMTWSGEKPEEGSKNFEKLTALIDRIKGVKEKAPASDGKKGGGGPLALLGNLPIVGGIAGGLGGKYQASSNQDHSGDRSASGANEVPGAAPSSDKASPSPSR